MNLKYHKNLDGVRAIAALLVMYLHYFNEISIDSQTLKLFFLSAKLGQTGVTLFFVLSGFLITRILLHSETNKSYFKNFYIRRSLRIFPLYYLILAIDNFLSPLIFQQPVQPWSERFYYYAYLQNFAITFDWTNNGPGHFWSLAVEEHFYLVWPFIIYFFRHKITTNLVIIVTTMTCIIRYIMLKEGIEIELVTFTRIDSLMIGGLLAFWERDNYLVKQNREKFFAAALTSSLIAILLLVFYNNEGNLVYQTFKHSLWSVAFFSIIALLIIIKNQNFINIILTSKFFTYTGKISYGLYVYHLIIYQVIHHFLSFEFWIIDMIVCFASSYLMASISYFLFEIWFLRAKKAFT